MQQQELDDRLVQRGHSELQETRAETPGATEETAAGLVQAEPKDGALTTLDLGGGHQAGRRLYQQRQRLQRLPAYLQKQYKRRTAVFSKMEYLEVAVYQEKAHHLGYLVNHYLQEPPTFEQRGEQELQAQALTRAAHPSAVETVKPGTVTLTPMPEAKEGADAALSFQDWLELSYAVMCDISVQPSGMMSFAVYKHQANMQEDVNATGFVEVSQKSGTSELCRYFAKASGCRRGDRCGYSHSMAHLDKEQRSKKTTWESNQGVEGTPWTLESLVEAAQQVIQTQPTGINYGIGGQWSNSQLEDGANRRGPPRGDFGADYCSNGMWMVAEYLSNYKGVAHNYRSWKLCKVRGLRAVRDAPFFSDAPGECLSNLVKILTSKRWVIHLFAGREGHWEVMKLDQGDTTVIELDLDRCQGMDLMRSETWRMLLWGAKEGKIDAIIGGPPGRGKQHAKGGQRDTRSVALVARMIWLHAVAQVGREVNGGVHKHNREVAFMLEYPEGATEMQREQEERRIEQTEEEFRSPPWNTAPRVATWGESQRYWEVVQRPRLQRLEGGPTMDGGLSFWETRMWKTYQDREGLRVVKFDEGATGGTSKNFTGLGTNVHSLLALNELRIDPDDDLPEKSDQDAIWSPGLVNAIVVALSFWDRDPRCAPRAPQLNTLSAAQWKEHVASNHEAFKKECATCVASRGTGKQHRRVHHPEAYVLTADVAGPLAKGLDPTSKGTMGKNLRYLLAVKYVVPKAFITLHTGGKPPDDDGCPKDKPKDEAAITKEQEQLLEELFGPEDPPKQDGEDAELEVLQDTIVPSGPIPEVPGELDEYVLSAEEEDDEEEAPIAETEPQDVVMSTGDCLPPELTYLTFGVGLPNNQAGTVKKALQDVVLYLQMPGFPIYPFHADKGEFFNHGLRNWLREQGVFATWSEVGVPQGNGRAESTVRSESEEVLYEDVPKPRRRLGAKTDPMTVEMRSLTWSKDDAARAAVEDSERILQDWSLDQACDLIKELANASFFSDKKFGVYRHGGTVGWMMGSREFPSLTKVLTRLVTELCPEAAFTSVLVSCNTSKAMHRDSNNDVHTMNYVIPISVPERGGELWVELKEGDIVQGEEEWQMYLDLSPGLVQVASSGSMNVGPKIQKAEVGFTRDIENVLEGLSAPLDVVHNVSPDEVMANIEAWKPAIVKEMQGIEVAIETVYAYGALGIGTGITWSSGGCVVRFLGMELHRADETDEEIYVHQQGYIQELLRSHGVRPTQQDRVPITKELAILPEDYEKAEEGLIRRSQQLAGEVLWLSQRTRPDLAFATSMMASMCTKSPQQTIDIGMKSVGYLQKTIGYRSKIMWSEKPLVMSCDAAYAPQSTRSHGGWLVTFGGVPIVWRSGRQQMITLSTAEAELLAMIDGAIAMKGVESLLADVGQAVHERYIESDTMAALSISSGSSSWRSNDLQLQLPRDDRGVLYGIKRQPLKRSKGSLSAYMERPSQPEILRDKRSEESFGTNCTVDEIANFD
ncbi:unnamed protein product [Symbiodinium sp. KB8]|nr:unnamed protein product [Symbiodinium sp. KB8]